MPHKRPTNRKKTRLKKADDLLEQAWDVLDPTDISENQWGSLRNVLIAVKAAIARL